MTRSPARFVVSRWLLLSALGLGLAADDAASATKDSARAATPTSIVAAPTSTTPATPESFLALCEEAEACFRHAVTADRRNGATPNRDDELSLRLDRLRVVMEKHPGSLWAKRAGLVSGVWLREKDPARAIQFLRGAKRDFPVLEDYVRLWTGEALLKLGDTAESAALLQSIAEAVPDSLVAARSTYEAAESWVRVGQCDRAVELFPKALKPDDRESTFSLGYLHWADCLTQMKRTAEARETLRRLWVKYPNSAEAREAYHRLTTGAERWTPSAEDRYQRAKELHAQAFHEEAVDEFRHFLSMANGDARVADAKQKLGLSLVRLKRYDHAKSVFQEVIANHPSEAGEAAVWLARVHLRQSEGDALQALSQTPPKVSLTSDQRAMLHILRGVWLEDQGQIEPAVAAYRKVQDLGESSQHRIEALWKIGWAWYRAGHWKDSLGALQRLAESKDSEPLVPQALYWMARASERMQDEVGAAALYEKVCQRYPVTYYCQLARTRQPSLATSGSPVEVDAALPGPESLPGDKREEITRDAAYRRAVELRVLGLDPDAARELTALTQRYSRDSTIVLALSRLLSETGAHGQALRLARLHFREDLEMRGTLASPALWKVGYPTVFVPTAEAQGAKGVDPYLVAAVIREESQYDGRAVSRVGAIGLMQVMPATASTVAKKFGLADVKREDLFDEQTNVRIGVRYLEQLLEQFQGNVVYAVASYNAGPQAVSGWIGKNGQRDPDEFVELIPYQETRLYVKRVVRSYREYLRLQTQNGKRGT